LLEACGEKGKAMLIEIDSISESNVTVKFVINTLG